MKQIIVVNHDKGEILILGKPIHFTPSQYKIIQTLVHAQGKIVSRNSLIKIIYGDKKLEHDARTIDQSVCRIRTLFKPIPGLNKSILKTITGRGYRLDI